MIRDAEKAERENVARIYFVRALTSGLDSIDSLLGGIENYRRLVEDIRNAPGSGALDRALRERLAAAVADAPIFAQARRDQADSRKMFDDVLKILGEDAAGSRS